MARNAATSGDRPEDAGREKRHMRVQLGKALAREPSQRERRSYVDTADEIFALPLHELKLAAAGRPHPSWPEECPKEGVGEFLRRVYALATQI